MASLGQRGGLSQDGHTRAGKPLAGPHFQITLPLLEVMTELAARGRGDAAAVESGPGLIIGGAPLSGERESDIFDDERGADASPASEVLSSDSIGSVFQNLPDTQTDSWIPGGEHIREGKRPPLAPPTALARGSSREAVQRGAKKEPVNDANTSSDAEEDLTSLTADVDESIEQLNQLILDLDPTFVPVPTHCSPPARSTSLSTNGTSHTGQMHQSGN